MSRLDKIAAYTYYILKGYLMSNMQNDTNIPACHKVRLLLPLFAACVSCWSAEAGATVFARDYDVKTCGAI